MPRQSKGNDRGQGGTNFKSNISQTQFFVLFSLCFFMPATVFLPRLMTEKAGNMAWVSPIVGMVIMIALFAVLQIVFRAKGKGLSEKSITILGKPLAIILCVAVMLFSIFLAAFYARHFAERVLLVYLTDTNVKTIVFGLMLVILIALSSGVLSFSRLCEVMFYIFIAVFVAVTIAGLLDGVKADNVLGVDSGDIGGILEGSTIMLLPFCIFICMSFFGERVNWRKGILKHGIKSTIFVGLCTVAVLVLCIGSLGVFGTQYLQMPYFAVTRQIDYLGPLKNIGSIVFSMWILSDFAIVATLCYSAAGVGQSLTHHRHRKIPIYVAVVVVFLIAIFAWRDMIVLNWFFDKVIWVACLVLSIGVPLLLLIVGLARGKLVKDDNQYVVDKDSKDNDKIKDKDNDNKDINEDKNNSNNNDKIVDTDNKDSKDNSKDMDKAQIATKEQDNATNKTKDKDKDKGKGKGKSSDNKPKDRSKS